MAKKYFHYVIAHTWPESPEDLSIYTYYQETQKGTMDAARKFLEYVRVNSPKHDWAIYKVKYKKVEDGI